MKSQNILRILLLIAALLFAIAYAHGVKCQEPNKIDSHIDSSKLYPIDEGYKNPSFIVFRDSLIKAIAKEDIKSIFDCIHDDIIFWPSMDRVIKHYMDWTEMDSVEVLEHYPHISKYENNQRSGMDNFTRYITIKRFYPFSNDLLDAINHGGIFEDEANTIFKAPYYAWIPWPSEYSFNFVVIDDSVTMRSESGKVDILSYNYLYDLDKYNVFGGNERLVKTIDGKRGFVKYKHLRNRASMGAVFKFIDGKWFLVSFHMFY